jgi:hypothetical protein
MDWVGYFCEVNGETAINAVDLDVEAPQAERPMIVYLRVERDPEEPCDLSPEEEADLLDAIEAHVELLAARYEAVYVGRSATAMARVFVCYASVFTILRHRFERAFEQLRSYGYYYHTASGRDAEWTVYRDFLRPGPNEMAAIAARPKRA